MIEFSLAPYLAFCLIATATPGPNNMINLAQGIHLGFWKALPFAIGTGLGVGSVLFAVTLGLGAAIAGYPWRRTSCEPQRSGTCSISPGRLRRRADRRRQSGLGARLLGRRRLSVGQSQDVGLGFGHGHHLSAGTSDDLRSLGGSSHFCAVAWMTQPLWVGFGTAMRGWLANARLAMVVNSVMAILLLGSTLPFLLTR